MPRDALWPEDPARKSRADGAQRRREVVRDSGEPAGGQQEEDRDCFFGAHAEDQPSKRRPRRQNAWRIHAWEFRYSPNTARSRSTGSRSRSGS